MKVTIGKKWLSMLVLMAIIVSSLSIQPASVEAALDLEAEAAILVDADSGKILYQEKMDTILPIASMTKMMSQYLILEAVDEGKISWEQEVPISEFVSDISKETVLSNVPLRQDYSYSVRDLYESGTIYSANASVIALADLIAGSETEFVKMMNAKAEELGLEDYYFVNSTGLNNSDLRGEHPRGTGPTDENQMSARATAKLAYALLRDYPEVLETSSIPKKTFDAGPGEEVLMENWNWMISGIKPEHDHLVYEGVDGLKTGSTQAAGSAFTGTAERNGIRLISVVMRTPDRNARFTETRKLLDYGFNQFEEVQLHEAGYMPEGEEIVPVAAGKEKELTISTAEPLTTLMKKGEEELYMTELRLDQSVLNEDGELVAPIEAGQEVGQLALVYNGEEVEEYLYDSQTEGVPVVTDIAVEKAGWFTMTMRAIGGFFSGIWTSAVDAIKGLF